MADAAPCADRFVRPGHVVILVEDDAGLRAALERMLRAAGFAAQSFADAEAALADDRVERADGLVIDVGLPALSGLDLLERLRARGVKAPAVVISARDDARLREDALRRGATHFLTKPFLGSALLHALGGAIGAVPRAPLA